MRRMLSKLRVILYRVVRTCSTSFLNIPCFRCWGCICALDWTPNSSKCVTYTLCTGSPSDSETTTSDSETTPSLWLSTVNVVHSSCNGARFFTLFSFFNDENRCQPWVWGAGFTPFFMLQRSCTYCMNIYIYISPRRQRTCCVLWGECHSVPSVFRSTLACLCCYFL